MDADEHRAKRKALFASIRESLDSGRFERAFFAADYLATIGGADPGLASLRDLCRDLAVLADKLPHIDALSESSLRTDVEILHRIKGQHTFVESCAGFLTLEASFTDALRAARDRQTAPVTGSGARSAPVSREGGGLPPAVPPVHTSSAARSVRSGVSQSSEGESVSLFIASLERLVYRGIIAGWYLWLPFLIIGRTEDSQGSPHGDAGARAPSRPHQRVGIAMIDLFMLGAIWAMVFAVYRLPLSVLTFDETAVLPERAAMHGDADWFWHLVSLNQTRLTNGGDFMLFRPGIFFIQWLGDVLARPDRVLFNLASVAIYAVVASTLYVVVRRWVGPLLAVSLCMLFVYPSQGYILVNGWHVSGYLLAMVFYLWGFLLLVHDPGDDTEGSPRAQRNVWLATSLLFLSTLFHEFAVVAISCCGSTFYVAGRMATGDTGVRRQSLRVARASLVAAGGYVLLYGINWVHYAPPWFFSPGEHVSKGALATFPRHVMLFLAHEGAFLFPWSHFDEGYSTILGGREMLLAVFALAPVAYGVAAVVRAIRGRPVSTITVACVWASLALILILVYGRTATRYSVGQWYYPMLGFFLLGLTAAWLGAVLNRLPGRHGVIVGYLFVIILVPTLTGRAMPLSIAHHWWYNSVGLELRVVSTISSFFQSRPGRCYGGLEAQDDSGVGALNWADYWQARFSLSNLETLLQNFACGIRQGRPVYALVTAGRGVRHIEVAFREFTLGAETWTPVAFERGDFGEDRVDQDRRYNWYEAKQHRLDIDSRMSVIARTRETVRLNGLQISFRSYARNRILYNIGIRVRPVSNTGSIMVAFVDNVARAFHLVDGRTDEFFRRYTPILPIQGTVTFRRDGAGCPVFLDQYLLGVLPDCPESPVNVDVVQWPNGTSGTWPESVSHAGTIQGDAGPSVRWVTVAQTVIRNALVGADEPASSLVGFWRTADGLAFVAHGKGTELVLFNDQGSRTVASLESGRLVAPAWNGVADVAPDGNSIAWSNGTRWTR